MVMVLKKNFVNDLLGQEVSLGGYGAKEQFICQAMS